MHYIYILRLFLTGIVISVCVALSLRRARLRGANARLRRAGCICTPARFFVVCGHLGTVCLPGVQDRILILDILLVCKLLVIDPDANPGHDAPAALLERVRHLLFGFERNRNFSLSVDLGRRRVGVFELHLAVGRSCVFGLSLDLGRRVVSVDGGTIVHMAVGGFGQASGCVLDQPPFVERFDFDLLGAGSPCRTVVLVLKSQGPWGRVGRSRRIVLLLREERVRGHILLVLQRRCGIVTTPFMDVEFSPRICFCLLFQVFNLVVQFIVSFFIL